MFILFYLFSILPGVQATNYFDQKCSKVLDFQYFGICPAYSWNIPNCMPFRKDDCEAPRFVSQNPCVRLDCSYFLSTEEGQDFLKSLISSTSTTPTTTTKTTTTTAKTTTTTTTTTSTTTKTTTTTTAKITTAATKTTTTTIPKTTNPTITTTFPQVITTTATTASTSTLPQATSTLPNTSTITITRQSPTTSQSTTISQFTTTTTSSITTPATTPSTMVTQHPQKARDPFCADNFICTEEKRWSVDGCFTFLQSDNPDCHLYCQLDTCNRHFNPDPCLSTVYHCNRKVTPIGPPTPSNQNHHTLLIGLITVSGALVLVVTVWFANFCFKKCKRQNQNINSPNVTTPLIDHIAMINVGDRTSQRSMSNVSLGSHESTGLAVASSTLHNPASFQPKEIVLIPHLKPYIASLNPKTHSEYDCGLLLQRVQCFALCQEILGQRATRALHRFGQELSLTGVNPTSATAKVERKRLHDEMWKTEQFSLLTDELLQTATSILNEVQKGSSFIEVWSKWLREGTPDVQDQLGHLSKVRGSVNGHIQRIQDISEQTKLITMYCNETGDSEESLDKILELYKKYFKEDIFSAIQNAAVLDLHFSI